METLTLTNGIRYNSNKLNQDIHIIIINSDAIYTGYYGAINQPQDAVGGAIVVIGAGIVDTFVNMEGLWIRTARRP